MNEPASIQQVRMTAPDTRTLSAAAGIFVAASSAAYILVDLASVNLPRYYPVLHVFSVEPIKDQVAMGFYGRFIAALVAGVAVTALFLLLSPMLRGLKLVHVGYTTVFAATCAWLAIAVIVVEEWHEWGLVKRSLDTSAAVNGELLLAIIGLGVFLGGLLLTAAAVRRVAVLNPPKR